MPIFYLSPARTLPFVKTEEQFEQNKKDILANPGIISENWESDWIKIEANNPDEAIRKFMLKQY